MSVTTVATNPLSLIGANGAALPAAGSTPAASTKPDTSATPADIEANTCIFNLASRVRVEARHGEVAETETEEVDPS